MLTEDEFYDKWRKFFCKYNYQGKVQYPEEDENDKTALIVMDDMPIEVINKMLSDNLKATRGSSDLWLVDTYERLPDFQGANCIQGTKVVVDTAWQSPFLGQTLADASAWFRGIPKPPKAIDKRYLVVLKREIFEKQGKVIICKASPEGEKETQAILHKIEELGMWITSYNRHCWEQDYENCEERYQ